MDHLSGDISSFTLSLCLYCRTLCSLNKLLVAKTGVVITIVITENHFVQFQPKVPVLCAPDVSCIRMTICYIVEKVDMV